MHAGVKMDGWMDGDVHDAKRELDANETTEEVMMPM